MWVGLAAPFMNAHIQNMRTQFMKCSITN